MIGVCFAAGEEAIAGEFFELFKTPWEPYRPGHTYDVLVITSEEIPVDAIAQLTIIYGSSGTGLDRDTAWSEKAAEASCTWVEGDGVEFPVYGNISILRTSGRGFLFVKETGHSIGCELEGTDRRTVRIGYDLFQEALLLLSKGQPASNGQLPTLDIHISILRTCILGAGIPLVEVLPTPYEYDFIACLTHDVDFVGIRDHKFDHTMWGFVYRASVKTLLDAARRSATLSKCLSNWKAVVSLPLVYLGICDDFWVEFDRYMEIERGLQSTYFFIPFKGKAGTWGTRPAPGRRAAKYDLTGIRQEILRLRSQGCEIGLHGLNAWRDRESASSEMQRIREVTGQSHIGVRMHWLYFGEESYKVLEDAGLAYDSTCGYNDAIGFRVGTTQAFQPLGLKTLIELPLNIQDTALFYPDRMNLPEAEAMDRCKGLIQCLAKHGGVLTLNWHTRSLSPERLWGNFYQELLAQIRKWRVWFGTAAEIARWYLARRSIRFERVEFGEEGLRMRVSGSISRDLCPLAIRVYRCHGDYLDIHWSGEPEVTTCRQTLKEV